MPKFLPFQQSFAAGEISPKLYGRFDIEGRKAGVELMENFLALPQGPAFKRWGFEYYDQVIPNHVVDGDMEDTGTDEWTAVNGASLAKNSGTVHGGSNSLSVTESGGTDPAARQDLLTIVKGVEYRLTGWIYSDGNCNAKIYVQEDGGDSTVYGTSGDVSASSWTEVTFTFTVPEGEEAILLLEHDATNGDGFVAYFDDIDIEETEALALGKIFGFPISFNEAYFVVITAGAIAVYAVGDPDPVFTDVHVYTDEEVKDLQAEITPEGNKMWFASRTKAPMELLYSSGPSFTFQDISFTATPAEWTGTNYPGTITFHQGRSWWGGTPDEPATLWASKSGVYDNMTTGSNADDAMVITLTKLGQIQWMVSLKNLIVGTEYHEYVLQGSGGIIIPGDVQANIQSSYGSAYVQAEIVGNKAVYVSLDGRKLRDIGYTWTEDNWNSRDIIFVSEHLTKDNGVTELRFAQNPDNLLICKTANDELLMATYERGNDIIGWQKHPITGRLSAIGVVSYQGTNVIGALFDRDLDSDYLSFEIYQPDNQFLDCYGSESATGQIDDADMESTGTGYWSAGNSASKAKSTSEKYEGDQSLAVTENGADDPYVSQVIYPEKEREWEISCWIKSDGSTPAYIQMIEFGGDDTVYGVSSPITSDEWTKVSTKFTIPAGEDVQIRLQSGAANGSGITVYFDNVVLRLSDISIPHLANQAVDLLVDGAVHPSVTLDANGEGTLQFTGEVVYAGFGYTAKLRTMPMGIVISTGMTVPLYKKMNRLYVKIVDSAYPIINDYRPPTRHPSTPMDTPEALVTEDILVTNLGWDRYNRVQIEQDLPVKTMIAGFFGESTEESL